MKTGDIVLVDLMPVRGGEKGKTRPCLTLVGSGHPWDIVIVVPITDDQRTARSSQLFVPVPAGPATGLSKQSAVDCFQIRCLSESRLKKKLGKADDATMDKILSRVGKILNIGREHL